METRKPMPQLPSRFWFHGLFSPAGTRSRRSRWTRQRLAGIVTVFLFVLSGCAHARRMVEVYTFQDTYFQKTLNTDYDSAYLALHTEIREVLTRDQFGTYQQALIDTFGAMLEWEKDQGKHDKRIPLLEKKRWKDPLPLNKPKAHIQSTYHVKFASGTITMDMLTGWDDDHLAIRRMRVCLLPTCISTSKKKALVANAEKLGVGKFFGAPPKEVPAKPGEKLLPQIERARASAATNSEEPAPPQEGQEPPSPDDSEETLPREDEPVSRPSGESQTPEPPSEADTGTTPTPSVPLPAE